jgi:hypothetical protein
MKVEGIDERALQTERGGAAWLVFVYEGGDREYSSWAVDSFLITDAQLPEVLAWLRDNLPADSCWALAVVHSPERPTTASELDVSWVVGGDLLNTSHEHLSAGEQRLVEEMLARRHFVSLV